MKFVHTIDAFHLWVGRPSTGKIPTGDEAPLFLAFRQGVVDFLDRNLRRIPAPDAEDRAYAAGLRASREWLSDRGVRT